MSEQTNSPLKSKDEDRKLMPPPRLELPDEIKPKFYVKKEAGEASASKIKDSNKDATVESLLSKIGIDRGAGSRVKGKSLSDLEPIKIPEALLALKRPRTK